MLVFCGYYAVFIALSVVVGDMYQHAVTFIASKTKYHIDTGI